MALFTAGCLGAARRPGARPAAAALTTGPCWRFAGVVVRGASVDRALTVAVVYLTAGARSTSGRTRSRCRGLAAVWCSVTRPAVVFDLGFALTFGATAGLVAVTPRLAAGARWLWHLAGRASGPPVAVRALGLPCGDAGGRSRRAAHRRGGLRARDVRRGRPERVAMPPMAAVQIAGLLTALLPAHARRGRVSAGWTAHPPCARSSRARGPSTRCPGWSPRSAACVVAAGRPRRRTRRCLHAGRLGARARRRRRLGGGVHPGHHRRLVAGAIRSLHSHDACGVGDGRGAERDVPRRGAGRRGAGAVPSRADDAGRRGRRRGDAPFDMGRRVVSPALRAMGVRSTDWLA